MPFTSPHPQLKHVHSGGSNEVFQVSRCRLPGPPGDRLTMMLSNASPVLVRPLKSSRSTRAIDGSSPGRGGAIRFTGTASSLYLAGRPSLLTPLPPACAAAWSRTASATSRAAGSTRPALRRSPRSSARTRRASRPCASRAPRRRTARPAPPGRTSRRQRTPRSSRAGGARRGPVAGNGAERSSPAHLPAPPLIPRQVPRLPAHEPHGGRGGRVPGTRHPLAVPRRREHVRRPRLAVNVDDDASRPPPRRGPDRLLEAAEVKVVEAGRIDDKAGHLAPARARLFKVGLAELLRARVALCQPRVDEGDSLVFSGNRHHRDVG